MDPISTLAQVRSLVTKAKNEEAAELLLKYVTTAGLPASSWEDTVRNLLAQYKRIQLDQQRSIISYDAARLSINQVTNGLLGVLTSVEAGEAAPQDETALIHKRRNIWMWAGIALAIVLGGASFLMLRNNNQDIQPELEPTEVAEGVVEDKCPTYAENSEFNIMLLPYLPLDGKTKQVETALRINLAELLEKYRIMGSVFTKMIDFSSPDYPLTGRAATRLAKPCKAQLIIWGTTEEDSGSDGIITTTKFRFIESENFSLTDLELNNAAEVDTVSSLSSIATSAELTEEIGATIRLILGLVAHETDHHEEAAEILGDVIEERGGVAENPKWGFIQADSYLRSGQEERAIEVYREMTVRDSTNVQALIQKGLLEYKTGNHQLAARDLNRALKEDPDNTQALAARSAVRVSQNRLYDADLDLQKLEQMDQQTSSTASIREKYHTRHNQEAEKLEAADQQLVANPNDTSAWRIKAEIAKNLGQFEQAEMAANKLLRIDPENIAALYTLIEIQPMVKDSVVVRRQLQRQLPRLTPQQRENLNIRTAKGGG